MYTGLAVSGVIFALFGAFLVLLDLYAPLGVSIFGLPFAIVGIAMIVMGYLRSEPRPVEAEPGKKFCWYCMKQIPQSAKECPECSLPQHETND